MNATNQKFDQKRSSIDTCWEYTLHISYYTVSLRIWFTRHREYREKL